LSYAPGATSLPRQLLIVASLAGREAVSGCFIRMPIQKRGIIGEGND